MLFSPVFIIPSEDISLLEILGQISDEEWNVINGALQNVKVSISPKVFAEGIAKAMQGTSIASNASDAGRLLFNLSLTFAHVDQSEHKFLDAFRETLVRSRDVKTTNLIGSKLENRLVSLFADNERLVLSAKAIALAWEHQQVILGFQIFTDLRPVFRPNPEDGIGGMFLEHQLKLAFQKENETAEEYFALNNNDLLKLRNLIDRALTKATVLEKNFENSQFILFHDEMEEA